MNEFSLKKEEIENILEEDYKFLQTIYDNNQIFGVFVYDKVCYGLAEEIKDISTRMYYLPTFEEMCTEIALKDINIINNNHIINIKDIRYAINDILYQKESSTIECFFSDYYIITPKFKKIYIDTILPIRENMFKYNLKYKIIESIKLAELSLNQYKNTKDLTYLLDTCKRRIKIDSYFSNSSIKDCVTPNKDYYITYLWNIKKGVLLPNITEIILDLKEMKEKTINLSDNLELEDIIKQAFINIIKFSLIEIVSKEDFLSTLTKTEKNALQFLIKYLDNNGEGIISISKLTEESNLSRPVFKNLLDKLKEKKVAEITSMGVKGTAIKIVDNIFLDIEN